MFEATKLGRKVGKEDFATQVTQLRTDLLEVQRNLLETKTSVLVVVSGIDGAGKGEVVDRLNEWLDARGMQTVAFWDETDEERERPRYWRFWRSLPARGSISILFGAWYMEPLLHRINDQCNDQELDDELSRIADFERMLSEDGTLIVKFWFHLPEEVQKKRLKELKKSDTHTKRAAPLKGDKFTEYYQRYEGIAERVIRQTDIGVAPWYLIEATDDRYRDLTTGRTLLRAIQGRLNRPDVVLDPGHTPAPSLPTNPEAHITILDHLDMTPKLEREEYRKEVGQLQTRLSELAWQAYQQKRSSVLVFEGVDAGGKGGAIRRITTAIDSRLYRAIPIAAPTDEEKAHHYLWRFWRHIPRAGRMTIYDRSWYGRVLVERVERFATENEWQRAYSEINEFEEELVEGGVILLKFWMQISQDEQLHRFQERADVPYKQHKITDEDWRNRERWNDYKLAVNEMVIRTSTTEAPWALIPGDDKPYARVEVLRRTCERFEAALKDERIDKKISACKGKRFR